jgi:hypothetical protein
MNGRIGECLTGDYRRLLEQGSGTFDASPELTDLGLWASKSTRFDRMGVAQRSELT